MAGRQPHLYARRHCNHRRRLLFARTLISADTVEALTAPIIRIRPPSANSISTVPAGSEDAVGGGRAAISSSGAIATGWNAAGIGARSQSCCRQRNKLVDASFTQLGSVGVPTERHSRLLTTWQANGQRVHRVV